jgi:hypothetical protein
MPKDILFTVIIFNSLLLFIPVAALLLVVRPQLWHYLFAIFLGIMVGWFDLRADEVSLTVLLLVVFGLFLGFAQPRHAWRWALLLALWVPLGGFVVHAWGLINVVAHEPNWLPSLFAFIPALLGAYGGAFVNWASTRMPRRAEAAD